MAADQDLLIDEQTWTAINDPDIAEQIARGLFTLKTTMARGPAGVKAARASILAEIEAAYLHTNAHRAALKLYLLSLTGQLHPKDEPLQLINGAIERGLAQIKLMKEREKRRHKPRAAQAR
ncbi:MAG TPA: hypothetical protein VF525_04310 [Pyrinomonadaceae bacterium]